MLENGRAKRVIVRETLVRYNDQPYIQDARVVGFRSYEMKNGEKRYVRTTRANFAFRLIFPVN